VYIGSTKMVGRKQGWLHLFYIRFHGENRNFSQRNYSTNLCVFWKDRTGSRTNEGCEKRRSIRSTEERHDAIMVPADLRSQYVISHVINRSHIRASK